MTTPNHSKGGRLLRIDRRSGCRGFQCRGASWSSHSRASSKVSLTTGEGGPRWQRDLEGAPGPRPHRDLNSASSLQSLFTSGGRACPAGQTVPGSPPEVTVLAGTANLPGWPSGIGIVLGSRSHWTTRTQDAARSTPVPRTALTSGKSSSEKHLGPATGGGVRRMRHRGPPVSGSHDMIAPR